MKVITRVLPFLENRLPSLSMFKAPDQWKYLYPWMLSQRKDYLLDHAIPWITFDAIAFLKKWLPRGIRVFEYGSGASTMFWVSLDATCVSVEHDPEWYAVLKERLKGYGKVDQR